jgi:hypothetical protein
MQSAVIPVSFMEEEKEFLGMMSIRQVLVIGPATLIIYIWITAVPLPFLLIGSQIILKILVAVLIAGLASLLSFYYLDKYELYFDKYLLVRITFARSPKVFYYNSMHG